MSAENEKSSVSEVSPKRLGVSPWRIAFDIAFTGYILWSGIEAAQSGNSTMSIIYFVGVAALVTESLIRYRRKKRR